MNDAPQEPSYLGTLDRFYDVLCKICLLLAGVALVVMTVIFAYLVYGRYVLNDTPTWVEQVSQLLLMVVAFLGAAVGVRQDTHLSVVYFRTAVHSKIRTVFVFITDVLMTVFGGYMFWYGLELTLFKWNTKIPQIHVSEGFRSLPLTICGALIFVFSLGHLIRLLTRHDHRKDSIE